MVVTSGSGVDCDAAISRPLARAVPPMRRTDIDASAKAGIVWRFVISLWSPVRFRRWKCYDRITCETAGRLLARIASSLDLEEDDSSHVTTETLLCRGIVSPISILGVHLILHELL